MGVIIFIAVGTTAAILWARGYRPDVKNGMVAGTGLLSANSFPTGASVYVNGDLKTATDNTINLSPGQYQVKITKDGYLSWEKTLKLQKELVTQTDALLFPTAPDLKALTFLGAVNPTPSSDGQKIAFTVASASSSLKNGLYVLDLSNRTLSFRSEIRQIAKQSSFDFLKADLVWSPDSLTILAWHQNQDGQILNSVILENNKSNEVLIDQTSKIETLISDWQKEISLKNKERISKLPLKLQEIMQNNTSNLYWSPDEEKIMYTATGSATIEDGLIPPIVASNTQTQERQIKPGNIYIYDLKEDRNFLVMENPIIETSRSIGISLPTLSAQLENIKNQYSPIYIQPAQWYSDSKHVIIGEDNKIIIQEYDGTNKMTVYSGPLQKINGKTFVFPWPDGSKLMISANLNQDLPANLYAISLK